MKNLWLKSILTVSVLCIFCGSSRAQSGSATSKRINPSATPSFSDKSRPSSDEVSLSHENNPSTSVAEVTPPGEKEAKSPISFSYLAIITGPALSNMSGATSPDDAIGANQTLNARHMPSLGYHLDDKITIAATLDFFTKFTDAINDGEQRGFSWGNPLIRIKHSELVKTNIGEHDFKMGGSVDLLTPADLNSRQSNTIGAVRLNLTPSLQFAHSGFSLSGLGFFRYYAQTRTANPITNSLLNRTQLYGGPSINYNISDKVTAFVLYEATIRWNTLGQIEGDLWHQTRSLTDVEPGINFKITDSFALTPYLNWFCNQPLSTTAAMLNVSVTML